MKYQKELKQYLANLSVLNVKLHNLHWNVVGEQFNAIHAFTEGLYDAYFKLYDEIAEILKIKGIYPPATIKTYLELTNIDELPENVNYTTKEVLSIIISDMIIMKDLAIKIREAANEEDDFEVLSEIEDHIKEYNKNLWILNSMTK